MPVCAGPVKGRVPFCLPACLLACLGALFVTSEGGEEREKERMRGDSE